MFDVQEQSLLQLTQAMEQGAVTSRQLVLAYLERIATVDRGETGLNAVLELNADALAQADAMDGLRKHGTVLSPLHGIPILIKANINTHDKMVTSAGSVALRNNFAPYDAHIVSRLRKAGAVLLGKANMTEFANYMTAGMVSGYSSHGGQVVCPYNPEQNPSGSSSGSAVAVAANLCAVAVGTETSGSVVSPARVNGIVGLKPTMGLVSRTGIIPISYTLDTAGPMGRTVADVAALLSVMAGRDEDDVATAGTPDSLDFSGFLIETALKGKVIGINRAGEGDLPPEVRNAQEQAMQAMEQAGARLVDLPDLVSDSRISDLMRYEIKSGLNHYLASCAPGLEHNTLEKILQYNSANKATALRYGQTLLVEAQNQSGNMTEGEYIAALQAREHHRNVLHTLFCQHSLDGVFSLTPINLPALTGYPAMTIPLGLDERGVPIGGYLFAQPFADGPLLGMAYALERRIQGRRNPFAQ